MGRRLLLLLLLLVGLAAVSSKKVRIPDDLRDVVDDEEDEDWKNWGKTNPKPKPAQRSKMDISAKKMPTPKDIGRSRFSGVQAIQVKLRKGSMRNKEDVRTLGMKWTSMLRTGGVTDNVYAIDEETLVVQLEDATETLVTVKKFLFADPYVESLEIKGVKLQPDPDDDDEEDEDDMPQFDVRAVAFAPPQVDATARGDDDGRQGLAGRAAAAAKKRVKPSSSGGKKGGESEPQARRKDDEL